MSLSAPIYIIVIKIINDSIFHCVINTEQRNVLSKNHLYRLGDKTKKYFQ